LKAIAKANLVKSFRQAPEAILTESRKIGIIPRVYDLVRESPPRNSEWTLKARFKSGFIQFNGLVVHSDRPFTVYMHVPDQMAYVILKGMKDIQKEPTDIKHLHIHWNDGSSDLVAFSKGFVSYKMKNNTIPFGYWVWFDLGWK
jgi:hypothetical protein